MSLWYALVCGGCDIPRFIAVRSFHMASLVGAKTVMPMLGSGNLAVKPAKRIVLERNSRLPSLAMA